MAATRRAPPLQIFQDPSAHDYDHSAATSIDTAVYNALAPLSDASSKHNVSFNPPNTSSSGLSPMKPSVIPPPQQALFATDSPIKKQLPPFSLSKNAPQLAKAALTSLAGTAPHMDKENAFNPPGHGRKNQPHYDSIYGAKAPLKRTLMEAAPLTEKTNKKHKKADSGALSRPAVPLFNSDVQSPSSQDLPDASQVPIPPDDGTKPQLSYAQLIGMAILRSPNHRLTLAQIYKWISDNYSFYRQVESGWQNSIRHNLSLNKAFDKQERPKDDPGKGNYWIIKPGSEAQFLKEKPRRNTTADSASFFANAPDAGRLSTAPTISFYAPPTISSNNIDSSKFPDETELSSDATIPASENAHEGLDVDQNGPALLQAIRSSPPPPADITSSPPPGPSQQLEREATPPPVPRFPGNSRSGSRKRKLATAGLGDSGYYSSIESSVTRGRAHLLTSDADLEHPTKRRGRAEEEIARIRSSSYDSPLKAGSLPKPLSSSPFRPFESFNQNAPLTPPVIFKKPAKPVASVSPNTNLRNHRDNMKKLLGSPLKLSDLPPQPFSPLAMELPDPNNFELFDEESYYNDFFAGLSPCRGSPEKRPNKRPRLGRAATTAGVLADVTSNNNIDADDDDFIPSPYRVPKADWPTKMGMERFQLLKSPGRIWPSPMKQSHPPPVAPTSNPAGAANVPTIQFPPEEDYFLSLELPSDGSEPGFDITQGFQKIGAPPRAAPRPSATLAPPTSWSRNGSPSKQSRQSSGNKSSLRPGPTRSTTTMF